LQNFSDDCYDTGSDLTFQEQGAVVERTPEDVQKALDELNLGITVRFFDNSTATSQQAADNIGCELGQIAKSLCFMADGQPILVIASGDQRVDERKLAAMFNLSRKRVKTATPEQCIEH
jgi:prolyl-tRNA editing enzyme YbaK/EbsC (Cys-tRNA(Pro) deacylase)